MCGEQCDAEEVWPRNMEGTLLFGSSFSGHMAILPKGRRRGMFLPNRMKLGVASSSSVIFLNLSISLTSYRLSGSGEFSSSIEFLRCIEDPLGIEFHRLATSVEAAGQNSIGNAA